MTYPQPLATSASRKTALEPRRRTTSFLPIVVIFVSFFAAFVPERVAFGSNPYCGLTTT